MSPAEQLWHAVDPALATSVRMHAEHVSLLISPTPVEYRPAAQGLHSASEERPVTPPPCLPALQL